MYLWHCFKKKSMFTQGLKDGIPIGLGYLSVSIGFGIAAVNSGLNIITSLLISMTNLTSAGQVAGISVIAAGGTLLEMAMVQLVINLRYSLMGVSLTQKLDQSFTTGHRLFLGTFITDENFAALSAKESINIKYMYGLVITPYVGWAVGTLIGASAGMILPTSVTTAMGVALYGMFIAIFVPPMKKSSGVTIAVVIAALLSAVMRLVPCFSFISYGFSVIIASVAGALVSAWFSCRKRIA